MNNTVGIMGCGWLGTPLALSLLKKGHVVKGTTTQIMKLQELRDAGIDPYLVELKETFIHGGVDEFLKDLDVLIINIPPGLRKNPESDYPGRMELLLHTIQKHNIEQLIYISSTAVFEDRKEIPTYTESDAANATDLKGQKLIAAEEKIIQYPGSTTIIRPGGLIGGDRHPIQMLAGRDGVSNPDAPINLTDREYLIQLILKVIEGEIEAPIFHAISEPHEDRKSYYEKTAQKFNLDKPEFEIGYTVGKKVVSEIY
ncbi:NAD(P)H-binding protein [Nonlabens marinus]|uniref:Protein yeeZ n=1 Tax=Nonlabens marinus S1-08 TaxID=1454201 RepID=W8VPN5_9FLAO|nr:NAD(P)H-binding protein [Nonlabens marinus]BAO54590.1 protein yeeZ precursor [Nonlabens marinus S1-08]